jgi:hypothetical protein
MPPPPTSVTSPVMSTPPLPRTSVSSVVLPEATATLFWRAGDPTGAVAVTPYSPASTSASWKRPSFPVVATRGTGRLTVGSSSRPGRRMAATTAPATGLPSASFTTPASAPPGLAGSKLGSKAATRRRSVSTSDATPDGWVRPRKRCQARPPPSRTSATRTGTTTCRRFEDL